MKRFCYMMIAIIVIAIGVTLLKISDFGTDPFNCMNLGVSSLLPIRYGTYQLLFNIVLFIPLFVLKPSILGPGAIANMFFSAYIVELFSYIFGLFGITESGIYGHTGMRMIFLLLGIVFMCFGAALYMECDMGIAAYDALGRIIYERSAQKVPYRIIRIITDVICIVIGDVTGSVVGVGTMISAFFTGPFISMFQKIIQKEMKL